MTAVKDGTSDGWLVRRWHHVRRRYRFTASAVTFVALAIVLSLVGMEYYRSILLAFDAAAIIYLTATAIMFSRSAPQSIRSRARREGESYWAVLLGSAAVAVAALMALVIELHMGKQTGGLQIALAVGSVIVAWMFINTIFAVHYAHEFYGDVGGEQAGLIFPGTNDPDYWDFVYFAFVIGMTFQDSDVQITGRMIRHVALAHSVIAFFFNVIVISVSVNIVAGSV